MHTSTFKGLSDDLVFKHVFSKKEILVDFLNSYFEFFGENKHVVDVTISTDDPIKGNKRKHKVYFGDIIAYLNTGEKVSIELYQHFGEKEFKKSLAYISRKFANQLERGQDYKEAKKVTGINIILHNHYKGNKNLVSDYIFRDRYDYTNESYEYLEMVLLNLDKINNIVYSKDNRYMRWLYMFKTTDRSKLREIAKGDEKMELAIKYMEDFLNDEEVQDVYDKITDIEDNARTEGVIEGARNNSIKTAKNLLKLGLSKKDISTATGLAIEEIESLQ